jgi:hypothetical protein
MVKSVEQNVEQGFNEDELQDIMNEIESLEEEFSGSEPQKTKPQATPKAEVSEGDESVFSDEEMNEVLGELNNMSVEEVEHKQSHKSEPEKNNVHQLKSTPVEKKVSAPAPVHSSSSSTADAVSMNFSVSGNMSMNMNFNVSGTNIGLSISEDGLTINMEGGGKFVLPIQAQHKNKNAA